jgi:hypothetical protein
MSDIDDKLNIMQNDAKLLGALATAEMLPQLQETYNSALSSTLQVISASVKKLSLSVAPMVKVAEQLAEPMRKYAEVTKAATEAMQVSCAPILKTLEAVQHSYLQNATKVAASCAKAMSTYADLSLSAQSIADKIQVPQESLTAIKRSGEVISFSTSKICAAIQKANAEWRLATFTPDYVQKAIDTLNVVTTLPTYSFSISDSVRDALASVAEVSRYVSDTVVPAARASMVVMHEVMHARLTNLQHSMTATVHTLFRWVVSHAVRAYHAIRPRPEPRIYLAASQVKVAATLVRAKAKVRERANHKPELLRINLPRIGNKDSGDASDSDNENLILAA